MTPWVQGLRFAPVGAEPMSTGHRAPHLLHEVKNDSWKGLRSAPVGSYHEVHWTSLGLRFASVGAEPMSTGHRAPHLLHGVGNDSWEGLRFAPVGIEKYMVNFVKNICNLV